MCCSSVSGSLMIQNSGSFVHPCSLTKKWPSKKWSHHKASPSPHLIASSPFWGEGHIGKLHFYPSLNAENLCQVHNRSFSLYLSLPRYTARYNWGQVTKFSSKGFWQSINTWRWLTGLRINGGSSGSPILSATIFITSRMSSVGC